MPTTSDWPVDIPPLSYFEDYYNRDAENKKIMTEAVYLNWVKRFYFGSFLYRRGWKQATIETLATLKNADDKKYAQEKLLLMGNLIAPEWSKNNKYRVINTRHMSIWGDAMSKTFDTGEQIKMIDTIYKDINDLLQRKIYPASINIERYSQAEVALDEELFLN